MNFRGRLGLIAVVTGCLIGVNSIAAPIVPSLIEDIVSLSSGGTAHDEALVRLRSANHAELIATVRSLLKQRASEVFAVRAVSELELNEMQTDVDQLVRTTNSFDVVQTAEVSPTELHEKLRAVLAREKNSALKSTLLGKIKDPLTDEEFEKIVSDPDYLVRESVVTQFFTSVLQLSSENQKKRCGKLLDLKPVQARTAAMNFYRHLDISTKLKLKSVWKNVNCASERVAETKNLCQLLQKEALK